MPLYFFHLSFGDRTLPDEEGVELSHRAAAREEALAVVRDLSNPAFGGNPRRWASWFLQVADHAGEFFRALLAATPRCSRANGFRGEGNGCVSSRTLPSRSEAETNAAAIRQFLAIRA
jgi:hypothetical protein